MNVTKFPAAAPERATVSCTVDMRRRKVIPRKCIEVRAAPVELFLEWMEGSWVLWKPRDRGHNRQILDCLPGTLHHAMPLAELRARSFRPAATLAIISFLGSRRISNVRHLAPEG